jgi:hypothetical protein
MLLLNPLMLVGLAAAAVPLILHLLSRARFREVEWGAMLFLDPGQTRQVHRARLNQWLLLLLRMALIATVAVALARPMLQGKADAVTGSHRLTAAIVLDCSGSMTYDENGHSRFELAQTAAKQVLRGLRPGDRAALVLMGVQPMVPARGEPTADLSAVAARIDEQRPGDGSADVKEGLLNAADLIERGTEPGETTGGDIFVIGDRQALSYRGIDDAFGQTWRQRAAQNGLHPYFIPVGGTDADDVAVLGLKVVSPPVVRGQSVDATAAVAAFGAPRSGVRVTLRLDGRAVAERTVNLAGTPPAPASADQHGAAVSLVHRARPQSVTFAFTAPSPGSHLLSAEVDTTGYTANDHYTIPLTVIEPIRVLLVSGDANTSSFAGAARFVRWALVPHQATGQHGGAGDLFSLEVMGSAQWAQPMLSKYQVVILSDVEDFTPAQVRELEQFVYAGGGLLVAPGALSRVEAYNALLYRDGAGILPAQLHEATEPDGSEATTLLGFDLNSPVFAFLRGRPSATPAAVIARYFPCEPRQQENSETPEPWRQVDATVLARYLSGQPFLIEGSSERGRVLLMTTSLDADWTTLPLTNFYLPFVQSAVRYLAGPEPERNLSVGQPIQLELPAVAEGDRSVSVIRPDGQRVPIDVFGDGSRQIARYTDTAQPGVYTINAPGEGPQFFATHGSTEEADLTQLTAAQWDSIRSDLSARLIDDSATPIPAAMAEARQAWELEPIFLGLALLLGVAELAMSRRGEIGNRELGIVN